VTSWEVKTGVCTLTGQPGDVVDTRAELGGIRLYIGREAVERLMRLYGLSRSQLLEDATRAKAQLLESESVAEELGDRVADLSDKFAGCQEALNERTEALQAAEAELNRYREMAERVTALAAEMHYSGSGV
jgi:hypothetical protein